MRGRTGKGRRRSIKQSSCGTSSTKQKLGLSSHQIRLQPIGKWRLHGYKPPYDEFSQYTRPTLSRLMQMQMQMKKQPAACGVGLSSQSSCSQLGGLFGHRRYKHLSNGVRTVW